MSEYDDTIDGSDSAGSDSARNPLEVLAAEFSAARRNGADPSIEEYVQRLPDQRDEARALLESIALFERVSEQEYSRHAQHRRQRRLVHTKLEQLGDFRILREIGRGGMGVIYEAEQITLKRRVALKVLASSSHESAKQLERFQREAEAIARLHHTNIVPVFGSGSQDGVHYFAMQLIDGQALNQLAELSFAEIGKLGMQAASALAYAHGHGVLHRDIKPSNLLLDKSGDVWVTDFGLAKLSDVGELTQTGDIMGTLKYMAPEQLEGRADERTDIYSLGLTLYELATRKPAFDISKSLANRIRNHEIVSPRQLNPNIPRDLETIILKATAFEPQHRYASAAELADDLRCYIEDRPIAARRASVLERLARWTRRNPALAMTSAAALLLLVTTSIVTSVGLVTTRAALDDAQKARDAAHFARLQADSAREQAVANQGRAEKNLNVALQAFDAIFDNVAQRGVPQSLSIDLQAAASEDDSVENSDHDNKGTRAGNSTKELSNKDSSFEVALSGADAELLNSLLKFYAQFAEGNGEDAALRTRTANAYHRIGLIQQRLGQGDAAIASYDEALKLLQMAHKQNVNDLHAILTIAKIYNDRGFVLSTMAKPILQIVNEHKAATRFLESQSESIKQQPEVRFELARGYDLAGSLLGRAGAITPDDMPRGGRMFGGWGRRFDVFGPRRDGPNGQPGGQRPDGFNGPFGPPPEGFAGPPQNRPPQEGQPRDRREDGGPGDNRRPPNDGPNRPRNMLGELGMALGIPVGGDRGPPPDGQPGNPKRGQPEFGPQGKPGPMWFGGRNPIEDDLRRAAEMFEQLSREFPERNDYLLACAQSQRHLMLHFLSNGRMNDAAEAFGRARQTLAQLIERTPRDPNVLLELADTLSTASARLDRLEPTQAEDYLRQAIDTCQQLCDSFPSVPEYQAILANSHDRLGMVELGKRHWSQANEAYVKAIERLMKLCERFPANRYYQISTLQVATHLAELRLIPQAQLNDEASLEEARNYLDKSLAAYQQAFLIDPMAGGTVGRAHMVRQRFGGVSDPRRP